LLKFDHVAFLSGKTNGRDKSFEKNLEHCRCLGTAILWMCGRSFRFRMPAPDSAAPKGYPITMTPGWKSLRSEAVADPVLYMREFNPPPASGGELKNRH
jgi:hypothetical protein